MSGWWGSLLFKFTSPTTSQRSQRSQRSQDSSRVKGRGKRVPQILTSFTFQSTHMRRAHHIRFQTGGMSSHRFVNLSDISLHPIMHQRRIIIIIRSLVSHSPVDTDIIYALIHCLAPFASLLYVIWYALIHWFAPFASLLEPFPPICLCFHWVVYCWVANVGLKFFQVCSFYGGTSCPRIVSELIRHPSRPGR